MQIASVNMIIFDSFSDPTMGSSFISDWRFSYLFSETLQSEPFLCARPSSRYLAHSTSLTKQSPGLLGGLFKNKVSVIVPLRGSRPA